MVTSIVANKGLALNEPIGAMSVWPTNRPSCAEASLSYARSCASSLFYSFIVSLIRNRNCPDPRLFIEQSFADAIEYKRILGQPAKIVVFIRRGIRNLGWSAASSWDDPERGCSPEVEIFPAFAWSW